jgi:GTP-binding protein
VGPGRGPAAQLADFREHAERMLPQVRGAPVVALSGETGSGHRTS